MQNKQAYLVIAHNNFNILNKQLKLLDDERNDFYIHVDIKAGDFDKALILDGVEKSKVTFIPRISVLWGDYSQVQVEYNLLKYAENSGVGYKYYHLLSGVDLPIKHKNTIFDFFDKSNKIYICCMSSKTTYQRERTKYYYPFINCKKFRTSKILKGLSRYLGKAQKFIGINRHKNKKNYEVCYCGWQWFSIPNEFAKHVIAMEKKVYSTFKKTLAPDESFIQTIAMNSEFQSMISKLNSTEEASMRRIDWKRTGGRTPYTFTIADYDDLMACPYMFARKFDEKVDMEIVDKIYQTIK